MTEETETLMEEPQADETTEETAQPEAEDTTTEPETGEDEPSTEKKDDADVLLSGDEDKATEDGVPEKYEYTPPEGFPDVTEEVQARLDAFGETAKGMKLTQDQYQQLIEYDINRAKEAIDQGANAYQQRVTEWRNATKADKELGGDDLKVNLATAKLAMDQYSTEGLNALLAIPSEDNPEGLGLGNHPEIIRLFNRVGRTLKEAELHEGGGKAEHEKSLKKMYPSMFKE